MVNIKTLKHYEKLAHSQQCEIKQHVKNTTIKYH